MFYIFRCHGIEDGYACDKYTVSSCPYKDYELTDLEPLIPVPESTCQVNCKTDTTCFHYKWTKNTTTGYGRCQLFTADYTHYCMIEGGTLVRI